MRMREPLKAWEETGKGYNQGDREMAAESEWRADEDGGRPGW